MGRGWRGGYLALPSRGQKHSINARTIQTVIRTILVRQQRTRWGSTPCPKEAARGGRLRSVCVCVCVWREEIGDLVSICLIHQRENSCPPFEGGLSLTGTGRRDAFIPTLTKSYLLRSRTCCLSLVFFSLPGVSLSRTLSNSPLSHAGSGTEVSRQYAQNPF